VSGRKFLFRDFQLLLLTVMMAKASDIVAAVCSFKTHPAFFSFSLLIAGEIVRVFLFQCVLLIIFDPPLHCRCLVAIVEHLLPRDYFSKTLIASQADQRVLRDLLVEKLPRLSAHFDALKYVSDVVVNSLY